MVNNFQYYNKSVILSIFSCVSVYAYYLFFSFFSVIGFKFQPGFLEVYSIFVALLSLLGIVWYFIKNHRISIHEALIYVYIIFVLISYIINDFIHGFNETAQDTMESFLVRSVPALFFGIIAAKNKIINCISRYIDIFIIFFTLCCTKILLISFVKGVISSQWGYNFFLDYQSASYIASYTFGLSLYKLFIDKDNTIYFIKKIFYIFSIAITALTSIYSGGRGGVVVIIVYLLFLLIYIGFIQKKATKLISFMLFVFAFLIVIYRVVIDNNEMLQGYFRAFEFLNPTGGINWDGTSGRLNIYKADIDLFINNPVFGYGICGAPFNGIERTHNILLDIVIDGGLVYLIFWIFIICYFFKYCIKKVFITSSYYLLIVIFVGEFVMLNFSNVYLRTSAIWFALSYVLVDSSHAKNDFLYTKS